jgi:HEPN domain-containing protein
MARARADLKVAERELGYFEPEYNVVCFLFQQFVEKYLKAFLIANGKDFKKTHNIEYLLSLCLEIDRDFEKYYVEEVVALTQGSVEARYPDTYIVIDKEYINKVKPLVDGLKKLIESKLDPLRGKA